MCGKHIVLDNKVYRVEETTEVRVPGQVGVYVRHYSLTPLLASDKPRMVSEHDEGVSDLVWYSSEREARIAFSRMALTGKRN